MNTVAVKAVFGKKDYVNYCRYRTYYLNKASQNIYRFPALLMFFVVLNVCLKNNALAAMIFVFAAFIPCWMELNLYLFALKDCERFKLNEPREFYELIFAQDSVEIKNKTEQATYEVASFWKLCFTKNYLYVFLTPDKGFIVPVSCFAEGEVEQLRKQYQPKLDPKDFLTKKPWYEK